MRGVRRVGERRDIDRAPLTHPFARELQIARRVDRDDAANASPSSRRTASRDCACRSPRTAGSRPPECRRESAGSRRTDPTRTTESPHTACARRAAPSPSRSPGSARSPTIRAARGASATRSDDWRRRRTRTHARIVGRAEFIDDDAVVHLDARALPRSPYAASRPMPATAKSASSVEPSANVRAHAVRRRMIFERDERRVQAHIDAVRAMQLQAENRTRSGGTERPHRRGAPSTTVTSTPSLRAVAATSRPIQPPPTTSTRLALRAAACRACTASSSVRR